jgi:hypothetical protein
MSTRDHPIEDFWLYCSPQIAAKYSVSPQRTPPSELGTYCANCGETLYGNESCESVKCGLHPAMRVPKRKRAR